MNKMYIDESDPCWSGYEMIGMKKKGGRKVPNCVPINEADGYCPQCLVEYIERSVNESEYMANQCEAMSRSLKCMFAMHKAM